MASTPPRPASSVGTPPPGTTPALRAVLALYTLFSIGRFGDVMPIFYRIPVAKILGVIMIVLTLTSMAPWQARAAFRQLPTRAIAVIAILAVLSAPLSIWPGHSVEFVATTVFSLMTFFFIAACVLADRRALNTVIVTLVLGVGAQAVKLLVRPNMLRMDAGSLRALSGSLDPNDTGALLLSVLPFAIMLAADRGLWRKVVYGGIAMVMVAAAVKTGSRGAFLGLIAVGGCAVAFAPPRRRLLVTGASLAGAAVFAVAASDAILERFAGTFSRQENYNFTARDGRIEVWKRGMKLMVTHPLLGVGPDEFEVADGTMSGKQNYGFGIKYSAAHSTFVELGAELGVIGLGAFCTALVAAGRATFRARRRAVALRQTAGAAADREANLAAGALTSLVGTTVVVSFLSFGWIPITYFSLAVCIGVCSGSHLLTGAAAAPVLAAAPRRLFRGGLRPAAWGRGPARPGLAAWAPPRIRGRGGYAR